MGRRRWMRHLLVVVLIYWLLQFGQWHSNWWWHKVSQAICKAQKTIKTKCCYQCLSFDLQSPKLTSEKHRYSITAETGKLSGCPLDSVDCRRLANGINFSHWLRGWYMTCCFNFSVGWSVLAFTLGMTSTNEQKWKIPTHIFTTSIILWIYVVHYKY